LVAGCALVALLAACTPEHRPVAAPSPSATPVAGGPADARYQGDPPVVTVDGLVHPLPRQGATQPGGVYLVSAGYEVRAETGRVGTVVVTRRTDQRVVLVQTPPTTADYRTTFAGVDGDMLVLGYETTDHRSPAQALLTNLATGAFTTLDQIPGALPMSWSTAVGAVVSGRYYYLANAINAELDCAGEVDLATLHARTVECGKFGEWLTDLHPADHGASWTHFHGSSYLVCRDGRSVHNGPSGTNAGAQALGDPADCGILDTTTVPGWQVWGTVPTGVDAPATETLRATDGSATVHLGEAAPRSLVGCGGYAWWLADTARQQVLRWRPGGTIERVYHDTGPDAPTIAGLACADGIASLTLDYGAPDHPVVGLATLG
jgi:hypothetical protein